MALASPKVLFRHRQLETPGKRWASGREAPPRGKSSGGDTLIGRRSEIVSWVFSGSCIGVRHRGELVRRGLDRIGFQLKHRIEKAISKHSKASGRDVFLRGRGDFFCGFTPEVAARKACLEWNVQDWISAHYWKGN